jgi:hypothetical protein
LVGLTVAEYMPRLAIKLQEMLRSLPMEWLMAEEPIAILL